MTAILPRPGPFGPERHQSDPREVVYIVGSVDTGPIKIGRTNSVPDRIREMQTGHPYELVPLLVVPGGAEVEHAMHQRFARHRTLGEWFLPHPDLLRAAMLAHLRQAEANRPAWGGDAIDPDEWLARCKAFLFASDDMEWQSDTAQRRGMRAVLHAMWANPPNTALVRARQVLSGVSVDTALQFDDMSLPAKVHHIKQAPAKGHMSTALIRFLSDASPTDLMALGVSSSMARRLVGAMSGQTSTMCVRQRQRR